MKEFVAVCFPGTITETAARKIKQTVKKELGGNVAVLVLSEGARVERFEVAEKASD